MGYDMTDYKEPPKVTSAEDDLPNCNRECETCPDKYCPYRLDK